MNRKVNEIPTEAAEQMRLISWANLKSNKYPELKLLHHIANGGLRDKAEAGKLKAQGVKPGVPDLCLPVARGGYHGLYIEMKRVKGGRLSDEQKEWIERLTEQGYRAVVCHGEEMAAIELMRYLKCGADCKDVDLRKKEEKMWIGVQDYAERENGVSEASAADA